MHSPMYKSDAPMYERALIDAKGLGNRLEAAEQGIDIGGYDKDVKAIKSKLFMSVYLFICLSSLLIFLIGCYYNILRSVDKKLIVIAAGAVAMLLAKAGVYGGLMGSIMLAMTVSMQNIMIFAADEKTDWKKYQKALPVSASISVYLLWLCAAATVIFLFSIVISFLGYSRKK